MKGFIWLFLLFFTTGTGRAQDLDRKTLREMLDSRSFVFIPQTAIPMSGSSRQITGGFELKVSGDSIVSYLPYFGRAYTITPGESGISFTSTSNEYKLKNKKKKGWDLNIIPADVQEVRQLIFTIFSNGYATLYVNSLNKQAISYYGYLKKIN